MYKIYINDNPLFLIDEDNLAAWQTQYPAAFAGRYSGQVKTLFHYIDLLEKATAPRIVGIYTGDLSGLVADFRSLFKYLEAAGGLVFNTEKKALFIFRREKWDLPKGKIEPGETPPRAAIREVQEETGLDEVSIVRDLCSTYHTYREKGKRVLKRTWWYEMQTNEENLIPQIEEDIELAVWVDLPAFIEEKPEWYHSIGDVVETWSQAQ
ncbi:MAG: NUDIX domain-containing protein [Lewinellaceae bacterium]|nr:NUDIX domain-containing protein [Lewinellaceae bacterium]